MSVFYTQDFLLNYGDKRLSSRTFPVDDPQLFAVSCELPDSFPCDPWLTAARLRPTGPPLLFLRIQQPGLKCQSLFGKLCVEWQKGVVRRT